MAKLLVTLGSLVLKASGLQMPHDTVGKELHLPQNNFFGKETAEVMRGHHYQPNPWLEKQSQEFIMKTQRSELKKKAAGNPKLPRYSDWNLLEICTAKVNSNLGGMGPDFNSPQEVRYLDVATDLEGRKMDLVMTNISEYKPYSAKRNQGNPCFAVINVLHGTDVQVVFDLVYAGTRDLSTTTIFRLEDWDLDENGESDGEEEIDVFYKFHELAKWNLTKNADITVVKKKGDVEFIAEDVGGGEDNPISLDDMERRDEKAEEVDLLAGAPQLMIDLKVNGGGKGRNYMFNMEYATTMTTTCGASCVIWGDPHIVTFDDEVKRKREHPVQEAFFRTHGWKADQVTVNDAGTFWLVNSRRIHIQGRYEHNRTNGNVTNLVEIAVGGEFLRGNTLKFGVEGNPIMFNDEEILAEIPSTFYKWHASERYVAAKYHKDAMMVKNGNKGPGIDLELPEGMRMTINRWKENLAVSISMCPARGGQDGHCGNYNGNPDDDTATTMLQRPQNMAKISQHQSLFRWYDHSKTLKKREWMKAATLDFHRELEKFGDDNVGFPQDSKDDDDWDSNSHI